MKCFNYNNIDTNKEYFIVKLTFPRTGNVAYRLRDEDGYNLIDASGNLPMVGCWNTKEELCEYVSHNDLKFYKCIYEECDAEQYSDIGTIDELNKVFRDDEEIEKFNIVK